MGGIRGEVSRGRHLPVPPCTRLFPRPYRSSPLRRMTNSSGASLPYRYISLESYTLHSGLKIDRDQSCRGIIINRSSCHHRFLLYGTKKTEFPLLCFLLRMNQSRSRCHRGSHIIIISRRREEEQEQPRVQYLDIMAATSTYK